MLENLHRKIDDLQERADALRRQYSGGREEREIVFARALEELSFALEELTVTAEELRLQGERLAESRLALESEHQRYRDLFEFAPDGYIVTSASGLIEEVNHTAAQMLRIQPSRFINLALTHFVEETDRHSFGDRLARLVGSSRSESEVWQLVLKPRKGEPFCASITVGRVRDGNGNVVGLRWLIRDMRDRPAPEQDETLAPTTAGRNISRRIEAGGSLSDLSVNLLKIKDEEQRRIGRELHDSTSQYLAALKMNLNMLDAESGNLSDEERKILSDSASLADQCLKEIRTISYLLHPPLLDEAGLPSAVRWYTDGFARRSGIRVTLEMARNFGRLPEQMERALFRVLQECLTNVHRHSGSPTATIHIQRRTDTVSLEVTDQGCGIPQEVDRTPGVERSGVGIMGMRERLRDLGGRLEIDSGSAGTRVRAVLPIGESAATLS